MNRTLPLHTVYELRSVATQAALDALAILQPRGQRDAPLGSSHCLGVQAQDIMLTPIVRFASHMTSGARDDYGSPLAIAGADDMALYELVERHRTAMNLRQSEMMWVVHYRDAVGLIALERAKAARTRHDLLFHARLLVPAARSCADAIGRHDQFRATARSWLAVLHTQNVNASAGLTCPNVDQLLDPAQPPAR